MDEVLSGVPKTSVEGGPDPRNSNAKASGKARAALNTNRESDVTKREGAFFARKGTIPSLIRLPQAG
jgi:hypothetical protein